MSSLRLICSICIHILSATRYFITSVVVVVVVAAILTQTRTMGRIPSRKKSHCKRIGIDSGKYIPTYIIVDEKINVLDGRPSGPALQQQQQHLSRCKIIVWRQLPTYILYSLLRQLRITIKCINSILYSAYAWYVLLSGKTVRIRLAIYRKQL